MKRILIVEDDPDFLLGLSVRLRAAGYSILVAGHGAAAVNFAGSKPPDLILLDIGIPGGNGLIVLDLLKADPKTASIPVIVLTGRDPATVKEETLELGAVAFFQKPVDNDELLKAIRKHAGEGRAGDKGANEGANPSSVSG